MFDTYITRKGGDQYIKKDVTVTEKRAPTDESVKILMEMEEKALDKLVSITKLDSNLFKATWHTFNDCMSDSLNIVCRFEMNGEEERFDFRMCKFDCRNDQELVEKVREKILEKLTGIFTYDLFNKNLKSFTEFYRR